MKQVTAIIDTLENLETSNQVIPDGMIVKEALNQNYKVGDGVHTFEQLDRPATKSEVWEAKGGAFWVPGTSLGAVAGIQVSAWKIVEDVL